VDYDYDPAASFERLATYAWREEPAEGAGDAVENPLRDKAVREAVSEELRARGFRDVGSASGTPAAGGTPVPAAKPAAGGGAGAAPDFTVSAFTAIRQRASVYYPHVSPWGCHGWGHSWWGWSPWWGGPYVSTWDEGTLVLDVADGRTRAPLWRGTASRAIDYDLTPEERRARLREAVREVLANFPPPR
jgi:hypothetical protein